MKLTGMRKALFSVLVGFILIVVLPSIVMATPINSPVATLGGTPIDFEGFAEGTLISNQYSGVTFGQDDGGTPMIDNQPFLFAYAQNSGIAVLTGSTTGGAPFPTVAGLTMTLDSLASSVEFFFSDSAPLGNYTIEAFGNGGFLLESFVIALANVQAGQWVGFTGLNNIKSVAIDSNIINDAFGIDDVRYISAVPEPATLLLLGSGLAGLGLFRKKFKK